MRMLFSKLIVTAGITSCLILTGCATNNSPAASPTPAEQLTADSAFPAVVKSCERDLTFEKAPERVVVLGDTDMSILAELNILDRVIGRTGELRADPYDEATVEKIKNIPEVASVALDTGGTQVSTEKVIELNADLVIGYPTGADVEALSTAGIPLYSPPAFCEGEDLGAATFDWVSEEVIKISKIFGMTEAGNKINEQLTAKLAALPKAEKDNGTVAVLYVMPGSKEFYTYGTSSMVQPIVEANGLVNVYADETKRVFDASMEDLLKRNPDTIVLLFGEGQSSEAEPTFMSFAGANSLKAVTSGRVITMAFSLTDPPTPSSVKGAEVLAEKLAELK